MRDFVALLRERGLNGVTRNFAAEFSRRSSLSLPLNALVRPRLCIQEKAAR